MKEYTTEHLRNLGLVGHAGSGKTSLAEALLLATGEIARMGSVDDGSTVSDYHPDEIDRKNSIVASILHCEHRDHKINIIDMPGYPDFVGEVQSGLAVVDLAVIVINAQHGVELGAERGFAIAEENGQPRMMFINRLDKENVDFDDVVQSIQSTFGNKAFPIVFPASPTEYVDVLRMKLLSYDAAGKAQEGEVPANLQARANELRESLIENAAEADDALLEKYFEAGELSEEDIKQGLRAGMEKGMLFPIFGGVATQGAGIGGFLDFIVDYAPAANFRGEIEGTKEDGTGSIKRAIADESPLSALVFKTISEAHLGELSYFRLFSGKLSPNTEVYNSSVKSAEKFGQLFVMNGKNRKEAAHLHAGDIAAVVKLRNTHTGNTICDRRDHVLLPAITFPGPLMKIAIRPKSKGDDDKMSSGLHALHQEDPAFTIKVDPELHQVLLLGQSELHLNLIVKRLLEKYGVEVETLEAKIPYRETIRGNAKESYRHKKQSGGAGQFGEVHLYLAPYKEGAEVPGEFTARDVEVIDLTWGGKLEFVNSIVGGVIDARFIPAIKKGVLEIMEAGVIAGYPVTDVRLILYDGKMHAVDSNENAFKTAGRMCFRDAFKQAKPTILEPLCEVEVTVPDEYMGDVMGDMSGNRGKILGMNSRGKNQVIRALAPEKELARYSTKLRSMTQGRGVYTQKFVQYEDIPHDEAAKLIKEYEEAKAQGN